MSAVRRKLNRSNRSALSSPYARPVRKSFWSFSGFLNYLNPLRHIYDSADEEDIAVLDESDINIDDEVVEESSPSSPAHALSRRGEQLAGHLATNGHGFPGPSSLLKSPQAKSTSSVPLSAGLPSVDFTFKVTSSASKNLDTVTKFLTSHANRPIAPEDINQMVALIQQSKPGVSASASPSENDFHGYQNEEPFRFETRAATTPPRSKSPSMPPRGMSAPRTLSRNPNGSYTWKGAGSARMHRTRNSFSSPAFRTPHNTTVRNFNSSFEGSGNNAKRCRVGVSAMETQSLLTQNQAPPLSKSPTTSQTMSTTTSLKLSTATPIRQRTPGLQKPTAPVVPSPLRQAWTGGSPSSSDSSSPKGTNALRQTETAKHVNELVNSLKSQDKVLDELRNPYEAANPVKRPTAPKRKRPAAPGKKISATAPPKGDSTTKEKGKEMSARAIIEATLPEGSKRSRPSPDREKPTTGIKSLGTTVEDDETEMPQASKRLKAEANGHAEDTVDVEMEPSQVTMKDKKEKLPSIKVPALPTPSLQPPNIAKSLFGPKSSMPKEPSKLRFSMQPESSSTPPSPVPEHGVDFDEKGKSALSSGFTFTPTFTTPSAVPERDKTITPTTNLLSAFAPQPLPTASTFTTAPARPVLTTPKTAQGMAKSQPVTSLPTFTFTFPLPVSSTSGDSKARDEVKMMPVTSLPTFDLYSSVAPASSSKGGFDWSAAGLKQPAGTVDGEWICDSCLLTNPPSATTKCEICEAPKPDGVAEPSKSAPSPPGKEWECSLCLLKNPASATTKCTICDAPKPQHSTSELARSGVSFNWAAAGLKPPTDG